MLLRRVLELTLNNEAFQIGCGCIEITIQMAGLTSPLRGHFAGLWGDDADLLCLLGVKTKRY